MDELLQIRRAHPEESGFLTDLAMRSKAHWPYDHAFLEDVRPDLTLSLKSLCRTFMCTFWKRRGGRWDSAAWCRLIRERWSSTICSSSRTTSARDTGSGCGTTRSAWRAI